MSHIINNVTNKFIVDTNFCTNKSEIGTNNGTNGKMRNDGTINGTMGGTMNIKL